ncbi:MAG: flippase-like domain-containing protein [Deltaproteobacteria bacterium]|nr:flippase-like domain-containing protein [Deltaproteobacteria bacterium]
MNSLKSLQFRRFLRQFFFLLGLAFFVYLVIKLKPLVLLEYLKTVGWNFLWILAVSSVWIVAYSLAWEIFLKNLSKRVNLWDIFKIKTSGEAINTITPLGWGGGDPARILMLKDHIPVNEGTASVVVDRTLNNLAIALFMLIGVLVTFIRFTLPPVLKVGLPVTLFIIVGVSAFLYYRSHEGLFLFFLDLLKKLRIKKEFSEKTLKNVQEIDGHISRFYKMNRKGFAMAFTLHFIGRLCGVAEIYLAARFLGHPFSMIDSYLLASMTVIINMIFVFVPGALGVMEGAFAGIFALLHLDPAVGTSIQIVRRTRMLFWTAIGFVFMAQMKSPETDKPNPAPAP